MLDFIEDDVILTTSMRVKQPDHARFFVDVGNGFVTTHGIFFATILFAVGMTWSLVASRADQSRGER